MGPISRHYVAAYTVSTAEGHIGYAKICPVEPDSAWDGTPALWKLAAGPFPTESAALSAAVDKAEQHLREASEFQLLWDSSPE